MTVLSHQRVQCDRCLTVFVLTAKRADHWGAELFDAGWRARPIASIYRHFCDQCADAFLAECEGKRTKG
jgi:hypothetical protein